MPLNNFYDYHFDNGNGKVSYILIETNDELGATEHYKGELTIPAELFNQRGTDDSIIWNYVMTQLNLQEQIKQSILFSVIYIDYYFTIIFNKMVIPQIPFNVNTIHRENLYVIKLS